MSVSLARGRSFRRILRAIFIVSLLMEMVPFPSAFATVQTPGLFLFEAEAPSAPAGRVLQPYYMGLRQSPLQRIGGQPQFWSSRFKDRGGTRFSMRVWSTGLVLTALIVHGLRGSAAGAIYWGLVSVFPLVVGGIQRWGMHKAGIQQAASALEDASQRVSLSQQSLASA